MGAPEDRRIAPYLLLAEFDIDEGSLLRHEYPSPTGTDEHLLAELMLPDGAHSRSEDWTIFFLNQGTVKPPPADAPHKQPTPTTSAVSGALGSLSIDGDPPLMHVLNLVRTKKDDSVRR